MASPSSTCKVLQANLHHSQTATAQLRKWLEAQHTAIALIQEPWIRAGRIQGLSSLGGKLLVSTDHDKPRSCIYTTHNIKTQPLTEFCCRDISAARLLIQRGDTETAVVFVSAYMPEAEDPPPHDLARLVTYCESAGLEVVIGADANAHHPLWGMDTQNARGKALVDYLFTTNLTLLNTGSEPTFINRRSQTIIDLTLATEGAAAITTGWQVSKEASCSDHRWIRFDIQVCVTPIQPRRNPRNTDRAAYTRTLETKFAPTNYWMTYEDTPQIDERVSHLTKAMLDSYQASCPETTPPTTPGKQPWWGADLERKRGKVRAALNRAMNTCADKDWDAYYAAKSSYKKCIRFRSSTGWRKYCGNIESCQQANRVRKILAQQNPTGPAVIRKPDNTLTTSPEEAMRVLIETHFPGCAFAQTADWTEVTQTPTENDWRYAQKVITLEKLLWAIRCFHPFKAAGPDGVFPALMQWGGVAVASRLVPIMRACLAFRYVPKGWREVKVIFIPKPGKSDYTNARSHRPISLTSFLLKTMERVCERELRDGALNTIPLHANQHAYSSGKSTESALHLVVGRIEEAIHQKGICLGTFIDIEGAFDKTNFSSISTALSRHGVEQVLTDWITNMLSKRVVRLAEEQQLALIARGCPQGGVLSPLLWNLVINDLITKLNANQFYTIGYADDLAILISGKVTGTICNLTQQALRIVERWCREFDLSVNPTKTELVMFTQKRTLGPYRLPKLFDTELQLADEVKYLGVILDSKLNWSSHLDNKLNKACITFWQCKRMIGKKWGLSPKIILWLYCAVIRPMITYGAVVWWPRTKLATASVKLQRLQRLACMATTGCMRTTPTAALEAMLGLPPLHLFIQQEATMTAVRLKTLQLWGKKVTQHTAVLEGFYNEFPMAKATNDRIPKQFVFDKKYKIQLHEDHRCEGLNPAELRIFTDGSKTGTGTGAGVFSEDLNIHIATPLGVHNTVFQAECMGISLAASAILAREVVDHSIRILSDSMAVLLALNNHTVNSGLIYECHQRLNQVGNLNNITIQWIKGHSDSRGNDAADELARRGSSMAVVGPEPIVPLPFRYLRTLVRQRTSEQHHKLWLDHSECRQAKEALPTIDGRLTKRALQLTKLQLRMVTAAITGHGSFNKHLFVIGVTDSPLCRACMEEDETAAHVLLHCPVVATYRAKYFGNPGTLREIVSSIKSLLAFLGELGWIE